MADDAAPAAAPAEEELPPRPEFHLDILSMVKGSQHAHGVKHADYTRYRQYCARRLRRIRKALQHKHGKGRFLKKPIEVKDVRDVRYLHLTLINAERAWSYAMQIKREATGQSRPRYHLQGRLAKAAKWGATLAKLCAETTDRRTALEAEAYSAFLSANAQLEREQWTAALKQFGHAKTIYEQLSQVSHSEQQHFYKEILEEIAPSSRYCEYNMRQAGEDVDMGDDSNEELLNMMSEDTKGAASDMLRSKLESVLQESKLKSAEGLAEVDCHGERVPIKNEKTRLSFLKAQELEQEITAVKEQRDDGDISDLMTMYDNLFVAYNDALDQVRTDLRAASKDSNTVEEMSLTRLQSHINFLKLKRTAERNLKMVRSMESKMLSSKDGKQSERAEKAVTPDDLVRMYDVVLGSLGEMASLTSTSSAGSQQLECQIASVKAFRVFFLGEAYAYISKWKEAQALFTHASRLVQTALDMVRQQGGEEEELVAMQGRLVGAQCRAHAQAFQEKLFGNAEVGEEMQKMSLKNSGLQLLDRIKQYDAGNINTDNNLVNFPPSFEAVPCKPVLFDLARNEIEFPDLAQRMKPERRGIRGWFGR